MIELIGFLASLIMILSFLFKNVLYIRIVNSISALTFMIYGIAITSYSLIFCNIILIGVNLYYIIKLRRDIN